MDFLEIILKNLLRRKSRSLLTATGLALAVAATTALLSIAWGYARSATDRYASSNVDVIVVRAGVAERITSCLSAGLADRLRALTGVAAAEGTLTEMVSLGGNSLIGVPLHGLDPSGFAMAHYAVTRGRQLRPQDRHTLILGAGPGDGAEKIAGRQRRRGRRQVLMLPGSSRPAMPWNPTRPLPRCEICRNSWTVPGKCRSFRSRCRRAAADPTSVRQLVRAHRTARGCRRQPLRVQGHADAPISWPRIRRPAYSWGWPGAPRRSPYSFPRWAC